MAYQDTSRLQKKVESLRNRPFGGSYASGLANAIAGLKANKIDKEIKEAEEQNQQVFESEMARYLREQQTGQTQTPYVQGGGYTHPDLQKAMLAQKLKAADYQAEARARSQNPSGTMGNTPLWFQDQEDNYRVGRMTPGGLEMLNIPEGLRAVPDSGRMGFDPSMIATKGEADTRVLEDRAPRIARAEHQAQLENTINQRTAQLNESTEKLGRMNNWIDDAIDKADFWTTGLAGTMLEVIPGTPAYDLVAAIDTIKANVGFDKLQEMRANSPTGGALGQVSEMENKLLQAVLGNLENSQSSAQLKTNLQELKVILDQIVNRGIGRYEADYGPPGESDEDIISQALKVVEE